MNVFRTLLKAAALALVVSLAVPPAAQADDTKVVVTKTKHKYVYYGDHDIYFAPTTKTYYWQEGNEWRSGTELPPASRTYVTSGGVTIELDTEKPYERNEWVVEHYKHKH